MVWSSPLARGRFHQVGSVYGALGGAGAHNVVYLIYEEDDLTLCALHLVYDGLQPFFELTAELGAGDESAHIKGNYAFAAENLVHIFRSDALGQPLRDGGLAHARLAYDGGIVLGAANQGLHQPADLFVAPPHTGSSLPWRASSVRSMPYFFKARYLLSAR